MNEHHLGIPYQPTFLYAGKNINILQQASVMATNGNTTKGKGLTHAVHARRPREEQHNQNSQQTAYRISRRKRGQTRGALLCLIMTLSVHVTNRKHTHTQTHSLRLVVVFSPLLTTSVVLGFVVFSQHRLVSSRVVCTLST